MSKVHIARQGLVTKSAIPNVSRQVFGTLNSTTLLLGNGTNGSTTITDSSVNNQSVTVSNVSISTAIFPTGMSSSIYYQPTGALFLQVPASQLWNWGTQNWTLEGYFYLTGSGPWPIINWGTVQGTDYYKTVRINTNGMEIDHLIPNTGTIFTTWPTVTTNTWNHLAVVRNGDVYTGYSNGTAGTPVTKTGVSLGNATQNVRIGWKTDPQYYRGYISNFRITVGAAVYTSNFTPPTLPMDNFILGNITINNNTYGVYQNY
jgi:hypothetical protein